MGSMPSARSRRSGNASDAAATLARRGFLLTSALLALAGCQQRRENAVSVYALLDTSDGSFRKLAKAVHALRETMGFLRAQDRLAVATIGACGLGDEAVILNFTAPDRSSERRRLVAAYAQRLSDHVAELKPTEHADVRSALGWAARQLAAHPATTPVIVLFSDLQEAVPAGCRREAGLPAALKGVEVIAINAGAGMSDGWRNQVEAVDGRWLLLQEPADVVMLLKDRTP